MSDEEFHSYKAELYAEIDLNSVAGDGTLHQQAFFEYCTNLLAEAGQLNDAEYTNYRHEAKGLRIDGFAYNELEQVFIAIVVDYREDRDSAISLSKTEMEKAGKRVAKYLQASQEETFLDNMEVTDPGRDPAMSLRTKLAENAVVKFRVLVFTDCRRSERARSVEIENIWDLPSSIEIYDASRLQALSVSGGEIEDFTIGEELLGGGLPVLEGGKNLEGHTTYLGVMPASVLSDIYGAHGQTLLESNVRTFLNFKGGVNKGLRNSLLIEPSNFFAYNNGITVTATGVAIESVGSQLVVKSLNNMQIVNGGQTTAAIYFAPKEKTPARTAGGDKRWSDIDLTQVSVQMKLTILDGEDLDNANDFKSKVAQFANTQNKIDAADLVSNHPFHINLEKLSRKERMPDDLGSKWFYERARGQYETSLRRLDGRGQSKFKVEYPKNQKFVKTDLALFENTWRMKPHIVKQGAQKNLKELGKDILGEWDKNPADFEAGFYRHLIAKGILFKSVDRAINTSSWYKSRGGGLKRESVTYSIALVRHKLVSSEPKRDINLDAIYNNQLVNDDLLACIVNAGKLVHQKIQDSNFIGTGNSSEFAKSVKGKDKIFALDIDLGKLSRVSVLTHEDLRKQTENLTEINQVSREISGIEELLQISSQEWVEIAQHNEREYGPTHKYVTIPRALSRGSIPTAKQEPVAIQARNVAYENGLNFIP